MYLKGSAKALRAYYNVHEYVYQMIADKLFM